MADPIDALIQTLIHERESFSAIADMYPPEHDAVRQQREACERAKRALIDAVNAGERKRCYDIVMAVRFHEIETDLRSVLSFIERGDTAEELKAERAKHR